MIDALVISCEHGGNRVPRSHAPWFRGSERMLASHRGYDRGALALARHLARGTGAPLVATTVSRLLIDCNRSLHHPEVFGPRVRRLPAADRDQIVARYYWPHRERVEEAVREGTRRGTVLHLGVHSFTPVRRGIRRRADVALLYDPARDRERRWSAECLAILREVLPTRRLRRNYPYRGNADGLTTTLRRRFSAREYLGIELEVNTALCTRPRAMAELRAGLARALEGLGSEPTRPSPIHRSTSN